MTPARHWPDRLDYEDRLALFHGLVTRDSRGMIIVGYVPERDDAQRNGAPLAATAIGLVAGG